MKPEEISQMWEVAIWPRTLGHCLEVYGVRYDVATLHNAANDSLYTMLLLDRLGQYASGLRRVGDNILV